MTWIVPNFRNKTVSQVESDTPDDIPVKIKVGDDGAWHEPDAGEQTLVVENNGPNSQPGTQKNTGEWVGIQVKQP